MSETPRPSFAGLVQALLAQAGMTQRALASHLHVERSTVAKWINTTDGLVRESAGSIPRNPKLLGMLEALMLRHEISLPPGGLLRLIEDEVSVSDRRTLRGRRAVEIQANRRDASNAQQEIQAVELSIARLEQQRLAGNDDPDAGRFTAARVQALLIDHTNAATRGHFDSARMRKLGGYVEQLVNLDGQWATLLRDRATLHAAYSQFSAQTDDLLRLYHANLDTAPDLLSLATGLQQRGEVKTAATMLTWLCDQLELEPWLSKLPIPVEAEERRALRVRAQVIRAWIDDDQGRDANAFRSLENLIGTREEPGDAVRTGVPSLKADILHRQGRILVDEVARFRGRHDVIKSSSFRLGLGKLRAARRIEPHNPHHILTIGRARLSLSMNEAEHEWQEAVEEVSSFGGPIETHLLLTRGQVARTQRKYSLAIEYLEKALCEWELLSFSQGAMSAAWELARCYGSLAGTGDQLRALKMAWLCRDIARRMGDPLSMDVEGYVRAMQDFLKVGSESELLEEVMHHYPGLFNGILLPQALIELPGSHGQGTPES